MRAQILHGELVAYFARLDGYEQQVQFSVSTTASIIWLIAAIVVIHGVYLILASLFGQWYSP